MKLFAILISFLAFSLTAARPSTNDGASRVIGGRPALSGEVPYQISLIDWYNLVFCGGALVEVLGMQVVLTTAGCVEAMPPLFGVAAGDVKRHGGGETTSEQLRFVTGVVMHYGYGYNRTMNDIALLFLEEGGFVLNENISTIALPQADQGTNGTVTISGFGGRIWDERAAHLQVADISVVNNTYCRDVMEEVDYPIYDTQICAGSTLGDISPCSADLGGPAKSDAGYLAGLVQYVHGCGHARYPGVYVRVSKFVGWMEDTVGTYKKLNGL